MNNKNQKLFCVLNVKSISKKYFIFYANFRFFYENTIILFAKFTRFTLGKLESHFS